MSTHTLDVDGATLVYDLHDGLPGSLSGGAPRQGAASLPLLLVGSPMSAQGFATLRSHFTDRLVVTFDPRNAGRSQRDEPTAAVTAQQHADDLHALVTELGGPVDCFATSGGATNALVLAAAHPDDLGVLVAHEPPMAGVLPDRAALRSAAEAIVTAYDAGGSGPAMAVFISLVVHRGPIDEEFLARPAPDPAAFGLPTEDDGSRHDALMSNLRGRVTDTAPDVASLRNASTTVVVGVGEESGGPDDGEVAGRAAYAVAAALGQEAVVFPGGHTGFLGGEFGQTGRPDEFAARLREVLDGKV